jgi:DNA-binding NtrC family response regulator
MADERGSRAGVLLIVESDVLLRLVTAASLREAGFEVLEAANTAEAMRVLDSMTIDALISDMNMPGRMDGIALAKWVRDRGLDTKIILTSATERSLGEAQEYASFLAKPYREDEVERLVRKVLPS